MNFSKEFNEIIISDKWMMTILNTVKNLELDDCWIGAGFVRNKIWDVKHQIERTTLNDVDVIYFDSNKLHKQEDLIIEEKLKLVDFTINWSVKNQALMHIRNGHMPYNDCNHAISFWPETATAVGVRLNKEGQLQYIAPYGLDDLFNLIVKPTPNFNLNTYRHRIEDKKWKDKWNKLTFY
ncbi:nucleotidyltransferase family protein [Pedobacter polaris]|uniref:Nucleotidyltransferase family protein n=1 Tax=Pedobacter polaris TaxID=2571273 RepID=A0A4U1CIH8_9SPHI|nr:nucleotidyltransferase family protein [Pedobacter polaris]TKC06510.1 nucleotidyltransferase family protein [Pedobacter polaris]